MEKIMEKINEKTTLATILCIEGAAVILAKHNLPCLTCPMAAQEISKLKIGTVAQMYGLNLKAILKELNQLIGKEK